MTYDEAIEQLESLPGPYISPDGITSFAAIVTAIRLERARLVGTIELLCGYVATCQGKNEEAWMIGLQERINLALQEVGDPDRVRLVGRGLDAMLMVERGKW